jgi:hypothetical protein
MIDILIIYELTAEKKHRATGKAVGFWLLAIGEQPGLSARCECEPYPGLFLGWGKSGFEF